MTGQGGATTPVLGIIGAGQLARMCAAPAISLGIHVRLFAEAADAAAAQVIPDTVVGDYTDPVAVSAWAQGCDVVTFDHEHVPDPVLQAIAATGAAVRPGPEALHHAQDKLVMRRRCAALGLEQPRWAAVRTRAELAEFAAGEWPVVVKTPRGGYDGKGVVLAESPDDVAEWWDAVESGRLPDGLLAEERVPYTRELAALTARTPRGELAVWPVVESVQRNAVCDEVLAPAPGLTPQQAARAAEIGRRVATELSVTGVLAVELFEVRDASGEPHFLVNELAMRPHNSGHWTMHGAVTSQFEQHVRAVLDLPLGATQTRSPVTVMTNIMGTDGTDLSRLGEALRNPAVRVETYGKGVRPGRKLGHVVVTGDDLDQVRREARAAVDAFDARSA